MLHIMLDMAWEPSTEITDVYKKNITNKEVINLFINFPKNRQV